MSKIQVQALTISNWHDSSAAQLRIYCDHGFHASTGNYVPQGSPGDGAAYQSLTLTYSSGASTLTIPQFNIDSTLDGLDYRYSHYSAFICTSDGVVLRPFEGFSRFTIDSVMISASSCTPSSPATSCCTWNEIRIFNLGSPRLFPDEYYTKTQINRLLTGVAPVWGLITGTLTDQADLVAALAAAGGVTTGAQTFSGVKTFSSNMVLQNVTINDNGWAGTGATSIMLQGADSSSASPNSSGNPSVVFQTSRSGGTVGTGVFGYEFGVNRVSGQGDQYGLGVLLRYSPDMSAFTAGGTNYFQTGIKSHIVLSPTNIPSGANAIGFNHMMAERTIAGVRVVGLQTESVNNSSTDADNDGATIDSTISLNVTNGGIHHGSVGIQFEASRATSMAIGVYPKRNSIHRFINDYTAAQYDCQGTVTVTNGSATITGSATSFIKELVKGDQVGIDGVTWYEVASTPVSNTSATLTAVYAGSTLSGQTLTKIVTPFRLLRPSYIAATDTTNTFRLIGLDANNKVKLDPDGTGVYAGTAFNQITDTTGAIVPVISKTSLALSNGLNSNITIPAASGFARVGGPTGGFSIGGLTNGVDGKLLIFANLTAQQMTIVQESGSSTATNRIATLTGADVVLRSGQSCATFIYSGTDSRWLLVSTN